MPSICRALVDDSEQGRALRRCTPFAGAIDPRTRWQLWARVREELDDRDFLAPLARDVASPLDRIPDLCIEVLSTNRAYDRVMKRFIYAEAGVAEYWIVDPAGVVERCSGAALARAQVLDDRLTSELLPGFELSVTELLGEP